MTTHYFIQVGEGKPFGVTKEDFVKAERGAGFRPKHGINKEEPCTGGFSANNIKGTVREVPKFFTPTVEEIDGIPADSNPFHYDSWSMGSDLVRGWMAMHSGFDNAADPQPLHNLILINTRTGQRFRVTLNDSIEATEKIAGCQPRKFLTAIDGFAVYSGDPLYHADSRKTVIAKSIRVADDGEVFIEHDSGESSIFECGHVQVPPTGMLHVDNFVDGGFGKNEYARWFFFLHRLAAVFQSDWHKWIEPHKLFCQYQGKQYRVTGASRMGDVWLTSDFGRDVGYELRVYVNECTRFSPTPEVGDEAV